MRPTRRGTMQHDPRHAQSDSSRWPLRCALGGSLLVMLLLGFTPGVAPHEDLGRHLLLGEIISREHQVPKVNLLTYTHPDFPFVNHHWLSEVILYQLHRLGGLNGLIVWQMVALTFAVGLSLLTVPPRRHTGLYWLAGIIAAVTIGYRADLRPELFTFVCVALYGWLFERLRQRDRAWMRGSILGVGAAWANLHIYFIFGIGMAGAFMVERCWLTRRPNRWVREAGWFAALLGVSSLGPNGLAGLLYPLRIFSSYGVDIVENSSPLELWQTALNPMLIVLPLLSVAVVAAAAFLARPKSAAPPRLATTLIALTALLAGWKMARSVPLLALTGLPLIGAALSDATSANRPVSNAVVPWLTRAASRLSFVVAALFTVGVAIATINGSYSRLFPAPIYPTPFGFDDESRYGKIRELVDRDGLQGPVLSDFNIGSLVEYQIYPQPGYADNRPEAFPASFWSGEYRSALQPGEEWETLRQARHWNTVIVSLWAAPPFIKALAQQPEWALVHVDDLCVIFVRNEAVNADIIRELGGNTHRLEEHERQVATRIDSLANLPWWRRNVEAERAVYEIYALMLVGGDGERIWQHLVRLNALYPDYELVYELMEKAAPQHSVELRPFLQAQARWPTTVRQVLAWADALVLEGQLAHAQSVLERGQWFFPLSPELREALQFVSARAPR